MPRPKSRSTQSSGPLPRLKPERTGSMSAISRVGGRVDIMVSLALGSFPPQFSQTLVEAVRVIESTGIRCWLNLSSEDGLFVLKGSVALHGPRLLPTIEAWVDAHDTTPGNTLPAF